MPKAYANHATLFYEYDAGSIDVTAAYLEAAITPDDMIRQMLVYPTVDCIIKANDSEKEIFLPASIWTPLGFQITSFNVKTIAGTGKIHWQGWYKGGGGYTYWGKE